MDQDFLREAVDRLEGYVLLQDQIDYEDFSQDDDVDFDYFISAEMINEREFEYGKDPIYNIRVFVEDGRVKHRYKSDFRRKTPTMNGSYPSSWRDVSDKSLDDEYAYNSRERRTDAKKDISKLAEEFFE
jgi:hypothetical protein